MLRSNLEIVRARISQVCRRAGRNTEEITLVCVTKGVDIGTIKEAIKLGVADIGENRVQEAREKCSQLPITSNSALPAGRQLPVLRWHLVGHLQRNKAKYAVKIFDLIHSVDSLELAQILDKEAKKIGKVQEILIEVNPVRELCSLTGCADGGFKPPSALNDNDHRFKSVAFSNGVNTSGEKTKFGIKPEETLSLAEEIAKLENLKLRGLMTIAPLVDDPEKARSYFRMLRELRDKVNSLLTVNCKLLTVNCKLLTLSMGMSADFEVAIEEGATMVRIGTAIFKG